MDQQRSELQAANRISVVLNVIGGLGLIALGLYLGRQGWTGAGGWYWVGSILSGLIGYGMTVGSTLKSGPCPACDEKHWAISDDEFEQCSACDAYLQGNDEALWLVGDEQVAEEPVFKVDLGEDGFYWPDCCCVCGEEATRAVQVEFTESQAGRNVALAAAGLAAGALVIRTAGGSSGSVQVPHCDEHDDGAALGKGGVLRLRSHGYYLRFLELNSSQAEQDQVDVAA